MKFVVFSTNRKKPCKEAKEEGCEHFIRTGWATEEEAVNHYSSYPNGRVFQRENGLYTLALTEVQWVVEIKDLQELIDFIARYEDIAEITISSNDYTYPDMYIYYYPEED